MIVKSKNMCKKQSMKKIDFYESYTCTRILGVTVSEILFFPISRVFNDNQRTKYLGNAPYFNMGFL